MMKEKDVQGNNVPEDFNEKSSTSSYGANPLFWIGTAVLVCLIFLTAVSVLDLRRDMRKPRINSPVNMGSTAIAAKGTVGLGICPSCNTKGIPQCFYCGNYMKWSNAKNIFSCPGCGRTGSPICPNCRVQMGNGGVLPRAMVAGFGSPPGYIICPGCGYTAVKHPGVAAFNVICPQCGGRMMRGQ